MAKKTEKIIDIKTHLPRKSNLIDLPKEHYDGWQNVITSVGTNKDKRKGNQVTWDRQSPEFWEQLYAGDYLSKRIVNIPVDDALSKWVKWSGVEKPVAKEIDKRNAGVDLKGCIERTWKWGRAYGGACSYIVTDTNDPASPLRQGERVIGLRDLSRYDLRVLTTDIEPDFGSPNWGHPRIYYLVVQMGSVFKGYPIHWTRMVRFDGSMVPRRTFIRNNYWHDSVLNSIYEVIQDYQGSFSSAMAILQDFNVGKYKMKNLANLMAAGKENVVKARIELLNYSKSVIRAMILDPDDEDYEDMSRSIEGLAEMLTKGENRLVAATDIPHTRLLGESPDGSNATGNSTTNQWYDHIKSEQENYLRPKMKRFTDALYYDIPDLDWEFVSLYQLTDKEKADLRKTQSETDKNYYDMGALDSSEITESRFGGDEYSMETKLDKEGRANGTITPGVPDMPEFGSESDDQGGLNKEGEEESSPDEKKKAVSKKDTDLPKVPKPAVDMPEASQTEAKAEDLPESLLPFQPNPRGVETAGDDSSSNFGMRNETIVGKEKVQPLVSQMMSEPMRDPRTDPKVRPGGQPNRARVINKTRGNGMTAPSGSERTDSGESAIMPRGVDYVKPGFVAPPAMRGDDEPTKEVAVIGVLADNRLLMGQRADTLKWTLPGGHIEPGETSISAAQRELFEETGIIAKPTDLNLVTSVKSENVMIHVFMLQTQIQKPTTSKNDPDKEVAKWRWVDVKNKMLPPSIAKNLQHDPNAALEVLGLIEPYKAK